jgi:DNA sulfur modification protein DndD
LAEIYQPPPSGCATEYLLGHATGEHRQSVIERLDHARRFSASDIKRKAKLLKEAREQYDDATAKNERVTNLPREVNDLTQLISTVTPQIHEAIRRLTGTENEIKKLKGDLHTLDAEIGRLQEEVARMKPEQKRVAVAERVHRVLDDLAEKLRPIALTHLQTEVTKHFLSIADRRFQGGSILFPETEDGAPVFQGRDGHAQRIDTMSGFERRSFGISFSLALAEITQRRVPLVIDTPLGNADSEYRPRLLQALTDVQLDQVIILTHDQEVTGPLLEKIEGKVCQKFLVTFDDSARCSVVRPNRYFGGVE